MQPSDNCALALGGGAALGPFEVGALAYLETQGFRYKHKYGTSVGGIIATGLAFWGDDAKGISTMWQVWKTIKRQDVYKKYSWPEIGWRFLQRKRGLYNNKPLYGTLKRLFGEGPIHGAEVAVVDLESGRMEMREASARNVFASATMPILWEPVDGRYVDGGVREIVPLMYARDCGADQVVAILCHPETPRSVQQRELEGFDRTALRVIGIMTSEIESDDVNQWQRMNRLSRWQASKGYDPLPNDAGTGTYRYTPTLVVRPDKDLGDSLDFSVTTAEWRYREGWLCAQHALAVAQDS